MDKQTYTATFPDYVTVTVAPQRKPGDKAMPAPREVLKPPVVIEDLSRAKAMKYARNSGATITDGDGEVIAAPQVTVTDNRAKAAGESVAELLDRVAGLEARAEKAESALESKQDRRGPKTGSKNAPRD